MADNSTCSKPTSVSAAATETETAVDTTGGGIKGRLSFSPQKDVSVDGEPEITPLGGSAESVSNVSSSWSQPEGRAERLPSDASDTCSETKNDGKIREECPEQRRGSSTEAKENAAVPTTTSQDNAQEDPSEPDFDQTANNQQVNTEENDAEVVRRAREEGCVDVAFPGAVTQNSCYRFVSEILKCILYQRQQLPMTYDQLVYSQKKLHTTAQDKDAVSRRLAQSANKDRRKCHQTLQEMEEVLQRLEVLFSLSRIPRVLLLMGSSVILPKEIYEINMEALVLADGSQPLRVSSCLRQLFRTLFVADLLSDTKPVRLMPTTVLALAHRDCGVDWFRPKMQFKVPTRVKKQVIALSTDPGACKKLKADGSDWQDYVWFQAPMTIKGLATDP
ncbi:MAD2L1-binding protein [Nothobranchius furzeri]|uniref:MAD2L1 binding protein n=1 Tax=Nothobranchius furzeri TaxID=105023 RepID=A0A1A8B2W3_NOTFU|nr:MAD2L1 binding protein [Nothobranchius furzeri]